MREDAMNATQQREVLFVEDERPIRDAKLVPAAGACGSCPTRTGNQPELFLDVKGADVCTDPKCFSAKRAAYRTQQLASAKEAGRTIIEGKTAAEIAPWGPHNLQGFVRPTDRCHRDRRNRTYGEIVGKKADQRHLAHR
jgi:hypothetical protein